MRDYGKVTHIMKSGDREIVLESNAIIPGHDLGDLLHIFEAAKNSEGVNEYSGNPSDWGVVKGIKAVVEATVAAMEKYNEGKD